MGDSPTDLALKDQKARGRMKHVSTFAFTATPKEETLHLFGVDTPGAKPRFSPFSLYSMRQAIEEGFILDVLKNFVSYRTYWTLLKKVKDDPKYDRQKASKLLTRFVAENPKTIREKVEVVVDHLAGKVLNQIGHRARAMLVTSSRQQAVSYKLEVDKYLAEKGYTWKSVVAFSGTVTDEETKKEYTETGMNGFNDSQTAAKFATDPYRLLIVANKFQTGFDQPLLHTMYVDKKLAGVNAVQTLSRLNRTLQPLKSDTCVLDFADNAERVWALPGLKEFREQLAERVQGWGRHHPLALLLQPLCQKVTPDQPRDEGLLAVAIKSDPVLRSWAERVVVEDWKVWAKAADRLSVDEQLETMTGLIGLHLHVALLWRLGDTAPLGTAGERDRCRPFFFVTVEGHQQEVAGGASQACLRAAYNFLGFWRERALKSLEVVARQAVDRAADEDADLRKAFKAKLWTAPRVWATIPVRGGKKTARATEEFKRTLIAQIEEQQALDRKPEEDTVRRLVVEALARPFGGNSSVVDKVKDILRGTGRAAGIVGPNDARSRRRYLLDERGLSLLAHLHACRPDSEIRTDEEAPASVEAFLDDIFERYGLVVTTERGVVTDALAKAGETMKRLIPLLPSDEAVRRNRALLDRRLDALRLVRRYSDASAVIVPLV